MTPSYPPKNVKNDEKITKIGLGGIVNINFFEIFFTENFFLLLPNRKINVEVSISTLKKCDSR